MEFVGAPAPALAPAEEDADLRRGPWTVEEDLVLQNYIITHGEGRWNSLARCAGLKRTGKSCRLRWLNYLRPDVRRGNITPEEQLLILELHSRWGNRWSKIAQHLPGRTDNEIKNYWRTRVQKHAKQLKCDVNSKQFKDVMRYLWMPRLIERIRAANGSGGAAAEYQNLAACVGGDRTAASGGEAQLSPPSTVTAGEDKGGGGVQLGQFDNSEYWSNWTEVDTTSSCGNPTGRLPDFDCWSNGDFCENLWSMEDDWLIQQQQL